MEGGGGGGGGRDAQRPYRIPARWTVPLLHRQPPQHVCLQFEVLLYKLEPDKRNQVGYLVDFRNLGATMNGSNVAPEPSSSFRHHHQAHSPDEEGALQSVMLFLELCSKLISELAN